ncbi:MAG: exopolysaccharide Pel transporter PelG [Candidatus Solibacter sp.]|nr:exopolysaccharide Pel transporter PelG [Candidatus Solibacter sp.]
MAGIGFELRRLTQRDDLIGVVQGYGYAALATSGPWLFTILSLSAIVVLGMPATTPRELATFRVLIVYNFAFSPVLAGPATIVTTRYLANCIHAKDVKQAPAMMVGSLTLVYAAALPIAAAFYLLHIRLDAPTSLAAILNFMLVLGIWVVSIFLTALKNYRAVTLSFLGGMSLGILGSSLLAPIWGVAGMLAGFNVGLAFILFTLISRVFAEYPTRAGRPFEFVPCFRRYWELALGALAYNAAIWVDKWVMWSAPERELLQSGLVSCPDYDGAMFLAYLSIVPSIAAFTLTIETGFFEKYQRFYDDIQRHVPYSRIEVNHRELIRSFLDGARNFLVLQGSISVAAILLAPELFEWMGVNFRQLGVFRLGLLGAFFHAGFLFLSIILSYFDQRRSLMRLGVLLLAANGVFTFVSLRMGFAYYGYGYFLSALVAFGCAFMASSRVIARLPYETFVRTNTSVQARPR